MWLHAYWTLNAICSLRWSIHANNCHISLASVCRRKSLVDISEIICIQVWSLLFEILKPTMCCNHFQEIKLLFNSGFIFNMEIYILILGVRHIITFFTSEISASNVEMTKTCQIVLVGILIIRLYYLTNVLLRQQTSLFVKENCAFSRNLFRWKKVTGVSSIILHFFVIASSAIWDWGWNVAGEGTGLLRLHSTYRHDLKIYSSDEGRVQVGACFFFKYTVFTVRSIPQPIL